MTPILQLASDALDWIADEMDEHRFSSGDATHINRFCNAVAKLGPWVLSGRAPRTPDQKKALEKLATVWGNMPLYLQHQVGALALKAGAAEHLESLIGPLPASEAEPPQGRPEPMF